MKSSTCVQVESSNWTGEIEVDHRLPRLQRKPVLGEAPARPACDDHHQIAGNNREIQGASKKSKAGCRNFVSRLVSWPTPELKRDKTLCSARKDDDQPVI
jgi:hypothetical protein